MTHPTDEELDTLVEQQTRAANKRDEFEALMNADRTVRAIAALRAQLAEARTELVRRVDMHECAMAERDDATLYSDEQKARADRAEAALAAQIEADAGIAEEDGWEPDKPHLGITEREEGSRDCAERIAAAIRNQPHNRTALDRLLADAEAKALRKAGAAAYRVCAETRHVTLGQKVEAAILALIPKEGKEARDDEGDEKCQ